jgi:hypothetical protein
MSNSKNGHKRQENKNKKTKNQHNNVVIYLSEDKKVTKTIKTDPKFFEGDFPMLVHCVTDGYNFGFKTY